MTQFKWLYNKNWRCQQRTIKDKRTKKETDKEYYRTNRPNRYIQNIHPTGTEYPFF